MARCANENVDHLAFLLPPCELELLDREKRSSDRRLAVTVFTEKKATAESVFVPLDEVAP